MSIESEIAEVGAEAFGHPHDSDQFKADAMTALLVLKRVHELGLIAFKDEQTEIVYAIKRTDGELMHGEYSWSTTSGPDDWEPAELDSEDAGYPDTIEFEMIEMRCRTVATKNLPENPHVERDGECDYCGEGWPCEWVRDTNQPTKEAERG